MMPTESDKKPREEPQELEELPELPEDRFRISSREIKDIPSLLEVLSDELGKPRVWVFRGQAEWQWSLTPKRGRGRSHGENFSMEPSSNLFDRPGGLAGLLGSPEFRIHLDKEEFEDWKAEAVGLIPPTLPRPSSDLEWLAIGQHYGYPTRLLDWTRNPLVGAYFAVRGGDTGSSGGDSSLFALRGLPALPASEHIDPWEIHGVRLWHPPSLVERIGRQSGLFTVHQVGNMGGSLDLVSYAEKLWNMDIGMGSEKVFGLTDFQLVKIRIPSVARRSLLRELNLLGVDEFFAFPDLEGLSTAYRNGRFRKPGPLQLLTDFD